MSRLMVRHRDADDLARCPRTYLKSSLRERGVEVASPGLDIWRALIEAFQDAHRAGEADTFGGIARHLMPPGAGWAGQEQRAELLSLVEAYLDLTDDLAGQWVEPPEENLQLASRHGPVVLDGRLWLVFDHGPDEVEVRKVEISAFHVPPDPDALRSEFSTCVLTLLTHAWRPRARVRFTLLALRAAKAVSCVWEEDQLPLARDVVRDWVAERLAHADFPATTNTLCITCRHLPSCPAIPCAGDPDPSALRAALRPPDPDPSALRAALRPPDPNCAPFRRSGVQRDAQNGEGEGRGGRDEGWFVFSPSRYRLFEQCPRRYRNRHLLGLAGTSSSDSEAASFGLAVHRVLADVHQLDPVSHRGLDAACTRVAADMGVDPDRVRSHTAHHLELCPGQGYLGGEVDLFAYDAEAHVLVHGRADAVWECDDGGIEVRDYKTGSVDDDLAVSTYAVLAAATYPDRRPVRVTLEDLSEGRLITRELGPAQLEAALEVVRSTAVAMRDAAAFPARPGLPCASCSFRDTCPEAAS